MKIVIVPLLSFLLAAGACSEEEKPLTYEMFQEHLYRDMTYQQMVLYFGRPLTDIGSGIHIYVYPLDDGTTLYLGYTNRLHYARHVSSDGQQLLHEILF